MGTSSIAAARRACSSAAIIPLTIACKIPSMSRQPAATVALTLAASALIIAACRRPDQTSSGNGFQERARQAGIMFRMHFLPKEQGETFHSNLYDHGAGLAVGDYDNDGLEDIYFLNQLGPNALYRNTGNGAFVDVTAKAGVALGDRVSVGATFADYDKDGWPEL